eukprot:1182570-Prorocentrum_minimum.AAC.2
MASLAAVATGFTKKLWLGTTRTTQVGLGDHASRPSYLVQSSCERETCGGGLSEKQSGEHICGIFAVFCLKGDSK